MAEKSFPPQRAVFAPVKYGVEEEDVNKNSTGAHEETKEMGRAHRRNWVFY